MAELPIRKYLRHLPSCYKKQDWTEALQAMAETPQNLRDESYDQAWEEMNRKMRTCTCGLEQLVEKLKTAEEGFIELKQALNYEIRGSWLPQLIWFEWGRKLLGNYYAWKVKKRYNRYKNSLSYEKYLDQQKGDFSEDFSNDFKKN